MDLAPLSTWIGSGAWSRISDVVEVCAMLIRARRVGPLALHGLASSPMICAVTFECSCLRIERFSVMRQEAENELARHLGTRRSV